MYAQLQESGFSIPEPWEVEQEIQARDFGVNDITGLLDPRTKEFQAAVRLTPATLAHYRTQGRWIPAKHLLAAASEIAFAVARGDARIIIEMPPRHGKSELASVHTPIWFLDRWPHLNVILTTYSADLSVGFGRRVRDAFLEDNGNTLKTRVREDVQRNDVFQTEQEGGMMSVGIGGAITGRGAHLLIVDDYVKNFEEAMSVTTNEATWNWFTSTAFTRLEPGGSVLVLATRWPSPDGDLIGKILAKEPGKWTVIRFPALSEGSTPAYIQDNVVGINVADLANAPADVDSLGRKRGEALWPERGYTRSRLLNIQSLLGDWLFRSMYQQDPVPSSGISTDISQFRYVDTIHNPLELRWCRSWDLAATDKEKQKKKGNKKGDFTVGSLVGTKGSQGNPFHPMYVADQIREQFGSDGVEQLLADTAASDGVEVPIVIEQEPGSAGKSYANHLANNVLAGYKVIVNPASSAKIVRDQPYLAAVSRGRVTLVRAFWNKAHTDEVKEFPNGKHDDTVDSAAQGYNYLFQTSLLQATWGRATGVAAAVAQPKTRKLVTGAVFGRRH